LKTRDSARLQRRLATAGRDSTSSNAEFDRLACVAQAHQVLVRDVRVDSLSAKRRLCEMGIGQHV
jgi:hypothetical protein